MILMHDIRFERVHPTDLTTLQTLAATTFEHAFAAYNTPEDMQQYMAEAFSTQRIKAELSHPEMVYYFARVGEVLAGYIKLNEFSAQTDLKDPESLELERIYVTADFQNQGIGKYLLEKSIELAREGGKKFLWLGVWDQNHGAIRFYQRHGFTKFATHDFYLGKDRQTDFLMRIDT